MKKKKNNNMKTIISVAVVLVVVLALGGYIWYSSVTSYVATMAGEKISSNEYKYFLATVKLEMENDANLTDEASRKAFWESKYEGNDARQVAKQRALESAKEFKIQFIKAKEKGMFLNDKDEKEVNDSINVLLNQMAQQFGSKKESEKKFEEIYDINVKEYKSILRDLRLVFKYVQEEQKGITVTDDELKKKYDENKNTFDKVTVRHILFNTKNPDQNMEPLTEDEQKEAKQKAEDTLKKVNDGEDMATLAKELSADGSVGENEGIIEVDYSRGMVPQLKAFVDWTTEHKVGDTGIVETDFGYHVMRIEDKTSYEDVVDKVKSALLAEKYNTILQQWTKESQYDLKENKFALDRIKV